MKKKWKKAKLAQLAELAQASWPSSHPHSPRRPLLAQLVPRPSSAVSDDLAPGMPNNVIA